MVLLKATMQNTWESLPTYHIVLRLEAATAKKAAEEEAVKLAADAEKKAKEGTEKYWWSHESGRCVISVLHVTVCLEAAAIKKAAEEEKAKKKAEEGKEIRGGVTFQFAPRYLSFACRPVPISCRYRCKEGRSRGGCEESGRGQTEGRERYGNSGRVSNRCVVRLSSQLFL